MISPYEQYGLPYYKSASFRGAADIVAQSSSASVPASKFHILPFNELTLKVIQRHFHGALLVMGPCRLK